MKRFVSKWYGKTLIFLFIGIICFMTLQAVLVDKSSYAKYRNWKEQDKVDILILGNSHAEGGIHPIWMEEDFLRTYGKDISVFNYTLYGMRIEQMSFFLNEILKYHTPKLIILETYAFCPLADEHREILAHKAFDVLPLNKNKIEAVKYCTLEDYWSYYLPFIKYHTRWKEISSQDISILYDKELWNSAGKGDAYTRDDRAIKPEDFCPDPGDGWFSQDTSQINELRALTFTEKECLEKMLLLLEEKNIQLAFVSVHYKIQMGLDSIEMIKINNYLGEKYVDNQSISLLDMNQLWPELNFSYNDLYDEGHVNINGRVKVMDYLLEYLKTHYDISSMSE